jgi:CubicO group peptidase (beta-lactamase class C family)
MKRLVPVVFALTLAACTTTDADRIKGFEREADELRQTLHIPGMSAAIVKDQKVLWMLGFGYADLEDRVPATPDTLYHVASVTKTFGSVLMLQLVEKGQLSLDEPIAPYTPSRYSGTISDPRVQIRHILSHTSAGTPGDQFAYNGNLYDAITPAIEKKYGATFRQVITQRILEPLQMTESVPGHDVIDDPELARRYAANLARFAKPYALYGKNEIIHAAYPGKDIGAAAGLLSTVRDLAKYDIAIDRHVLLQPETQELAWTPFMSNAGEPLPYGLGWFISKYRGERLIWHTGNWGAGFSALYFKVPAKNVSMILLANSEGLADGFHVPGAGETNPFACAFLRHFVLKANDRCKEAAAAVMNNWLSARAARYEPAITLDEAVLASYAGEYRRDEKRTHKITREGTRLFIDIPRKGDRSEMFASPKGDFFFKVATDTRIRFIREGETVTELEFTFGEGEQPIRAKKIR